MKRVGHLFEQICSMDNLRLAHEEAKRGKAHYKEVIRIEKDPDSHLKSLRKLLLSGEFITSEYRVTERMEGGKLRVIHVLPYFPDRIVQHAILLICGEIWRKSLIRDTYQSLPGRGTSDARKRVTRAIQKDKPGYYLQMDVRKFYPSINNEILKKQLARFTKCPRTNKLIFNIIDSVPGLPIGNLTSQIWGNLNLSPVDWYAKQVLGCKHYFRYCDDIILLHDDPKVLNNWGDLIEAKVRTLGLNIKPGRKLGSLATHGLDFCGYVFSHTGLRLRQRIKESIFKAARQGRTKSLAAYWGWVKPLHNNGLWLQAMRGMQ